MRHCHRGRAPADKQTEIDNKRKRKKEEEQTGKELKARVEAGEVAELVVENEAECKSGDTPEVQASRASEPESEWSRAGHGATPRG